MPKPFTENTLTGDILNEWDVPEFEQHMRGVWWYILMISFGLFLVLYALVTDNFLFALVIILGGIVMYLQSNQEPDMVPFTITELGVVIGDRFYPYAELDQFYIIYDPPDIKDLYLETRSAVRPTLHIPLRDEDPVDIRDVLLDYLDEDVEKEEEPLSETIRRHWKLH